MTYEEAKNRQLDCFKAGAYVRLFERSGEWFLADCTKEETERDMLQACVAVVKRLPTRLRVIPGGKNDAT